MTYDSNVDVRHGAMATYLGIDASLEGTGLCLVSAVGAVLRVETVNPRGLRGMARLALIKAATTDFMRDAPVTGAAIEGYAFGAVNQAFSLGEVGGVLRLLLHEWEVPYIDVPPINLKKFATGFTEADKPAMVAAAVADGALLSDHNQADAYFLARIALALAGVCPRQRTKLEVIRGLTNPAQKKVRRRPRRLVANPV